MGSLGFLLPFRESAVGFEVKIGMRANVFVDIERYKETLKDVWDGEYRILERMRLACQVFDARGQIVERCAGAGNGESCSFFRGMRADDVGRLAGDERGGVT
jgi:NAD kinase